VPGRRITRDERFRILVESVKDYAIFMLDPGGHVRTWNTGAKLIKGYQSDEIIGKHIETFYTEVDRRQHHAAQLLTIAARDGRVEEEGWRVRKDGTRFWADVVVTALRNENGELTGFAKVTRDLSERKRAEQDRDRLENERVQRAAAEEAVRIRDEFLSIASHELRTPLTAVQIELHALKESTGGDDPRLAKRLARAARNTDRLAALVDSLMDVSRIAAGRLTLKPEPLELSQVLAQLVDGLRSTALKARCELSFAATGPVNGSWDRLRLEQVVMNLIGNALKYGSGAPVRVSLNSDDGKAVIEVVDGGPGIPETDLKRIFERFERAASMRHYGGMGLGLYVSREIVQAMGGTISAKNLPGGGACFTVRLPCEASAAERRSDNVVSL
jgi:PAS domain S-box-containing protein